MIILKITYCKRTKSTTTSISIGSLPKRLTVKQYIFTVANGFKNLCASDMQKKIQNSFTTFRLTENEP